MAAVLVALVQPVVEGLDTVPGRTRDSVESLDMTPGIHILADQQTTTQRTQLLLGLGERRKGE